MSRVHLLKCGGGLETSIAANHENQTKFKKLRASAWCTVNFQACSLLTQGSTNNRKRIQSPPEDVSQQHNKIPDSYLATLLPTPALLLSPPTAAVQQPSFFTCPTPLTAQC